MVQARKPEKRKMTLDEIIAFNKRLEADPKILAATREADAERDRGEPGVKLSDLRKKYGRH